MKILVKFPTRSRRAKFFQTLDKYIELAEDLLNIAFVITCDIDDPEMNCQEAKDEFEKRQVKTGQIYVRYGNSKTKIEACNADVPAGGWDILLLASDDMIPRAGGWDKIIRERMAVHFPDLDGVLHFYDGHQGDHINTLSIIGRNWYNRFGYIYNPIYRTMYCDTEFTEVSRMLNRESYFRETIIEHVHPYSGAIPFDDLYRRNNDSSFDAMIYEKRKANNFFLKKTLIVQPGRFGDILICLPIAKHFYDQSQVVYWLCPKEYHDLFRSIDYVTPVSEPVPADQVIDLSFGFGGNIEAWWQGNKESFESFVTAKYFLAGVNLQQRWNLKFNRNYYRENALLSKFPKHYILTHEVTHSGRFLNLDIPGKVEFKPVEGFFNIFDWYLVIKNADEIHCIDSALSNFIEAVPEFLGKKKYLYLSARHGHNEYYLRSMYRNGWMIR